MSVTEKIVNLDLAPEKRWAFLADHTEEVNLLLDCYLRDFEEAKYLFESIGYYKKDIVPADYLDEISYIASISKFNEDYVLIANLYYDVLKFYFGCTAFAVSTKTTTFHCRNLDWHTENNLLGKHSMVFDFQRNGKTVYKTVGWPGFVGALSGIRPRKFSITLNAVLSNDKPEIAFPISFLIRDVLASAQSYEEAKYRLEHTPIASDCLILLSGVESNERVVIERTPRRFASRESNVDFIVVTNDYKKIENGKAENELQATSCGRYDRAMELLSKQIPMAKGECMDILRDVNVMMGITVQQIVFDNKTGEIVLIRR
jgi:acid ceramidase